MSSPHWFRFTLNQLMVVTAVFALLMAAAVSDKFDAATGTYSSFADPRYLLSTAVRFAGAGVCLYNLRLSRGMWLVLAGYLGPWLVGIAINMTIAIWYSAPNTPFPTNVARMGWAAIQVLHLIFVLGLALTFRDIRRRLSNFEVPQDLET